MSKNIEQLYKSGKAVTVDIRNFQAVTDWLYKENHIQSLRNSKFLSDNREFFISKWGNPAFSMRGEFLYKCWVRSFEGETFIVCTAANKGTSYELFDKSGTQTWEKIAEDNKRGAIALKFLKHMIEVCGVKEVKHEQGGSIENNISFKDAMQKFDGYFCAGVPYTLWNYNKPAEAIQKYLKEYEITTSSPAVGILSVSYTDDCITIITPDSEYEIAPATEKEYDEFYASMYKEENEYAQGGNVGSSYSMMSEVETFARGGDLTTLSALKKKLQKGQAVKMVYWFGQTPDNITAPSAGTSRLGQVRYVVKVQTNGVYFSPNQEDTTGSYWEFPAASLVEVTETGFKVYGIGTRPYNAQEQAAIDNEPRDPEQDRIDAISDGSTMYYMRKNYYQNAGFGYLYNNQWERGLKKNDRDNNVFDKSIKGALELEYVFVNEAPATGDPELEGYGKQLYDSYAGNMGEIIKRVKDMIAINKQGGVIDNSNEIYNTASLIEYTPFSRAEKDLFYSETGIDKNTLYFWGGGSVGACSANKDAGSCVAAKEVFSASHLNGMKFLDNYVVFSYGYYPIFVYSNGMWFENDNGFSASTRKQMGQVRKYISGTITKKTTEQLKDIYEGRVKPQAETQLKKGSHVFFTARPALSGEVLEIKGKDDETAYVEWTDADGKLVPVGKKKKFDVAVKDITVSEQFEKGGSTDDTFVRLFKHYGFTEKRGGFGVRKFFNKDKGTYAAYDATTRSISIGDDDLRFSVRDVMQYLKDNGYKADSEFEYAGKKYFRGGSMDKEYEYSIGKGVYWGTYHVEGNRIIMDTCQTMNDDDQEIEVTDDSLRNLVYATLEKDKSDEIMQPVELDYFENGGTVAGWMNLFAHPERFMKYDGQFLYPPRVEHKLQPASLEKLDTSEYIGEPKMNGSNTSVTISEKGVVAKERHNTFFAIPPKFDFKALHRGKGAMCLVGEFMNKSKLDDAGKPFRGFCIWDIVAFENKILIGSTIEERLKLLNQLYPSTGTITASSGQIILLFKTDVPDIYKVNTFYSGFSLMYEQLSKVDMVEGFVLKRKNGKLEMMTREQNNIGWSVKVRKPTSNYMFSEGGGFDIGTKVGMMRGAHKGEKGYISEIDTTYKISVDGEKIKAHEGDFYNNED